MKTRNFFSELKRRDVYKVAAAYVVASWLLIQAASILLPTFDVPAWVMKVVIVLLALGFILAVIVAWVFEITPYGIKRTANVSQEHSAEIVRQLETQAHREFVRGYLCALTYAGMADKTNAIDYLHRVCLNHGNGHNADVSLDPAMSRLSNEVLFESLADEAPDMAQLGLGA